MSVDAFLQQVITAPEGYFNLCLRSSSGMWHEEFYEWPGQLPLISATAQQAANEYDVYFSSYLFGAKSSSKANVLPSRTLQEDLDGADPSSITLTPTALVQTSPGRYQAYWLIKGQPIDLELHELLSKRLAYSIPNCDKSGWSLGHKVRLPGTFNHKYLDGPHPVLLLQTNPRQYDIEELELLPDVDSITLAHFENDFIYNPPENWPVGPFELVDKIKDQLSAKVYSEYHSDNPTQDRSASLWALMLQCFKHGLRREEVYWVAKHSVNNKFDRLKFHAERELAKDVLRAEHAHKTQAVDIIKAIDDVRKATRISVHERRRLIYDIVLGQLKSSGSFIKMHDARRYYILHDRGMPVYVSPRSEQLGAILDMRFGLNKTETEHDYVAHALNSYTTTLPEVGMHAALSYHDSHANHLLVHSGQRTVYRVTPDEITQVTDGAYDVVFPWQAMFSPFVANIPDDGHALDWGHELFGNYNNVLNLASHEVEALLKTWFMFILFRSSAKARPILAFFGQPGSGKTTLACKIYTLIYGTNLEVSGVTSPEDFDMASAHLPVLVLDNLDTWEKWIPDRLAQAARTTDVLVRRKYTDMDIIRLRRQAVLVITAHDPKFARADITSRLIILSMSQLSRYKDEQSILDSVLNNRNKLWGAILKDVQAILKNPLQDADAATPQIRIQDFARLGDWIALGLGCQELFREALTKIKGSQFSFSLSEDAVLVNALKLWLQANPNPSPKPQDDLFNELLQISDEPKTFLFRYRNSVSLGKRLSNLQSSLNTICSIQAMIGKGGQRMWIIQPNNNESEV